MQVLGASLHDILARLKGWPQVYPKIKLVYSHTAPISCPIIIILPQNGLRLRFDGPEQRCRLIEVIDYSKVALVFTGNDIKPFPDFRSVYKSFGPTTPGEYLQPDKDDKSDAGTYILSYPGIAFRFPVRRDSFKPGATWSSTVSLLSSCATRACTSLAIFAGESWSAARLQLFDGDLSALLRSPVPPGTKKETIPREIELAKIHDGARIELVRSDGQSTWLVLGETTPQDLVMELGPPDSIHCKPQSKISMVRQRQNSSTANSRRGSEVMSSPTRASLDPEDRSLTEDAFSSDDDETDEHVTQNDRDQADADQVFYNYYSHGLDILVSNPTSYTSRSAPKDKSDQEPVLPRSHLVATKVILHGNIPGSWPFNRHRRIRWLLHPDSYPVSTACDVEDAQLTSETPLAHIQAHLRSLFRSSYNSIEDEQAASLPMVVNRALAREEIDVEEEYGVIGSWEDDGSSSVRRDGQESEAEGIGGAEVYGFPGLIFEVLRNGAVSSLTVY